MVDDAEMVRRRDEVCSRLVQVVSDTAAMHPDWVNDLTLTPVFLLALSAFIARLGRVVNLDLETLLERIRREYELEEYDVRLPKLTLVRSDDETD